MTEPNLARLLTTDHWLVDANGDGLPDDLRVRIVLPESVSRTVVTAVGELAARLGHETMALSLPLVVLDRDLSRPLTDVVVVGSATRWLDAVPVADKLAPGDGEVVAMPRGNVAILGGNAEGEAGALRVLARHVPDVPGGVFLPAIIAHVESVCTGRGHGVSVTVRRLMTQATRPVIAGVELSVIVQDGEVPAVARLLQESEELGPSGIQTVIFRVLDSTGWTTVRRTGSAPAPQELRDPLKPPPTPRLDLTRLYSRDGLLIDTDDDFIPDDTRAHLELLTECGPQELAEAANIAARLGLESTGIRLPLDGPHPVRVGPALVTEPPTVRIVQARSGGVEAVEVRGAPAARWLAQAAPGPANHDDPLVRVVEQITEALTGLEDLPPRDRVVWEETWNLPWEVDEVRELVRAEVLPRLRNGAAAVLDIRVSEPVAVRARLQEEVSAAISARGATPKVKVRSAYKQGFSWLTEDVVPILRDLPGLHAVVIRCRDFRRHADEPWFSPQLLKELYLVDEEAAEQLAAKIKEMPAEGRWLDPPIRWLLELYPGDELLPLPRELVHFEVDAAQDPTYVVLALDANGATLWQGSFTVTWGERAYLDAYPDLGTVHPSSGWVRAEVDGQAVIDQRILTDVERVWERYQSDVLPRLASYVRDRAGGTPRPEDQPFFSALEIHASISESDEPLPVREERVSSLEALHEDLYFVTLEYLKELGRREGGAAFEAPGQVIPWIHDGAGKPPHIRWVLKVFAHRAGVEGGPVLPPASGRQAVRVTGIELDAEAQPTQVELAVDLPTDKALAGARARLTILAHQLPVAAVARLQAPGEAAELFLRRDEVVDRHMGAQVGATAEPRRDAVMDDEELQTVLAGLARLPSIRVWEAGRSFQGRRASVVEAVLPPGGALASHAKQIGWKPTLLINARHHGNEPSSTISSLEMSHRLATDLTGQGYLRRINLVAIPFENLDGGALAAEMQREHPGWMLHAGRFNALGLEMRNAYGNPESPSRESQVLPRVWQHWLPDIVVDDHGFPSHEWTQPFSGYIPLWPAYWLPRGLAYAYLRYIDDPAFPRHKQIGEQLRTLMEQEVARDPDLLAWNREWADRYLKYAHRWLPEAFPFEKNESLLVYFSAARPDPTGTWDNWGTDFSTLYPQITAVAFVTEIADETAQGGYMDLCARAHEAIDLACVRLLAEADPRLSRRRQVDRSGVSLWAGRERPVAPRYLGADTG